MLKKSLHYFLAVARHGSIRSACTELNIAESAVSRQIQALEHEIGTALFERSPGGMLLTSEGKLLLEFGRTAAARFEVLAAEVAQLRNLQRGHVEVASIESMVPSILPRVLATMKTRFPAITCAISVTQTNDVVAAVSRGAADIGIGFNPALGPDFDVAFRSREPLLAVMAPHHPLARRRRVSLADIARWPVALSPNNTARLVFDQACAARHVTVTPALETNSLELIRCYVEVDNAITVLLRQTVTASLARGTVSAVPFTEPGLTAALEVFTSRRRTVPGAARAMATILTDTLEASRP